MDYIFKVTRAMILWHGDQKRRYTGEPYIAHPVEVAGIIAGRGWCGVDALAAALLHDVLEDTSATFEEVAAVAGERVARMVLALTNERVAPGRNRATRKAADRERLAGAGEVVQTIKVADLLSNAPCIREHDPKFWVTYRKEARDLLDALVDADTGLREELRRCLA